MNKLKKIKYMVKGEVAFYYGSVKGLYELEPQAKLITVTDFDSATYQKEH